MAESTLGYDDPAAPDKNLHSWQRAIGGTNVEDQVVLLGEQYVATYTAIASGVATTTSASHLVFIQGDGTNVTRLRGIVISQAALAGGAATADIDVLRTTTAGSGGGTVNARPFDTADTDPYAGTIQTLPTSKGTEGNPLLKARLGLVAAQPVDARNSWSWWADRNMKPILIPAATANGVCIKIVTGIATATLDITLHFSVTTF